MCANLWAATPADRDLYQQRGAYKTALDHLRAGRTRSFRAAKAELASYALFPYLEYHELQSRLSAAKTDEVVNFRAAHPDLPVARIMYWRWLKRLGQRREWRRFLDNYETADDPALRCYRLRALYGTGQRETAFAEVGELWTVASSLPKACDPLLDVWIKAGHLTHEMAWERLQLTLAANQLQLSRYLHRFFDKRYKPWAQSLYNVHVNPALISRTSRYAADTELSRVVIEHGLRRYANRDSAAAEHAWHSYRKSHSFTEAEQRALDHAILIARADDGVFPTNRPPEIGAALAGGMSTAAVAQRNWSEAYFWIEQLPEDELSTNRWQYWFARALATTHLGSERARLTYRALAEERDYYGFLAAERIGSEVHLNRSEHTYNPVQVNQLRRVPAVNRAVELYAVGDLINARREWNALIPQMDSGDQNNAGYLVLQMGWTSQGIRIANEAGLFNNLDLRFPLVYQEVFRHISAITTVPHSFLIAIARQESAFDPQARSSANARGLMQLLPSTATTVAKRSGLRTPSTADLYNPVVNVEISGHHLARLMTRYGDRRPLVAAAYNAGQRRVDGWIKDASGTPVDVWIETIPFRETRNYVKNVLAFDQVYSQLLGSPTPMLHVHEATVP
ncbi:MAG: transglycosylase SLT domain-containing protein [Gammaproteobacteria bacterium]|nr:transglycosylase SLT domain-containing protein [Gammaproteobacteria bacterium]